MLRRLLARLREAILARPVRVLVASLLFAVLGVVLGSGVEFRTSRSELAPEDDPEQQRLEKLLEESGGGQTLVVCAEASVEPAPPIDELRDFVDALAEELLREPLVGRVFHKVNLEWFTERGLFLVPVDTLRRALDQAAEARGALAELLSARDLAEVNDRIAAGLESGLAETSALPGDAAGPLDLVGGLLEAERRLIEDPEGFVAELENEPPMVSLAGDHPALASRGYLATRDGRKLFLVVTPREDDDSLAFLRRFVGAVRGRSAAVAERHPGFRIALTGEPAMTVEEMDTVRRDTWFTSTVAVVGVTVLTFFVFRWKTHALLVLSALGTSIIWAFGAVKLELGYLNLITSSFISTLVGVGVAYGIHPVSEYELEGAHTGDPRTAVREAYHRTGAPITVAAVTTSAAFLSILLMKFRGFAELGLVAGVGVLLCLLGSLVMLPALLVLYGSRRRRRDRSLHREPPAVDRLWVEQAAGRVCRVPRTATVVALLLTAFLAWSARAIEFNTNLLDLLPENAESLQYQRRMVIESDLSPISSFVVTDSLDTLRAIAERAEGEPAIQRVDSVLRFLPQDPAASREQARRLLDLFEGLEVGPSSGDLRRAPLEASLRRMEAALAAAAEAAFGSGLGEVAGRAESARGAAEAAADAVAAAPDGAERAWSEAQRRLRVWAVGLMDDVRRAAAAEAPGPEDLPPEIRQRFVTGEGRYVAFLQPTGSLFDPDVLEEYVAACRRLSADASGFPLMLHRMSRRITKGFYRALAAGSVLVLAILLVDYRNVRDAALAAVPLAMGVVWMLGFMGLLGLSFNFANLVAVPLIVGVGIDNGVHVVHRVRLEGDEGMSVVLRHTGRAILIASLATMIGFGSLALASHRGLASLGMVLILGVGSCLVTSTLVLPNLLVVLGRVRR